MRQLATALCLTLLALPAGAAQVKIFRTADRAAFLEGTLESISIDRLGRLQLADRLQQVARLDEPFLFAAAAQGDGWIVGTGNSGRVLRVAAGGQVEVLFTVPEPEVFAVWADADGTVFAGSSPQGKVYRWRPGGTAEVFFDPGQTYIWALARAAGGRLLVATGTQGQLFAVDAQGQGSVLLDSHDTHIRSLLPLPDGGILAGTAGEGLVLHIDAQGHARTLYDAAQPEIVALAAGPDAWYAAAVASEASLVDLNSQQQSGSGDETQSGDSDSEISLVTDSATAATVGSRPGGFSGGRSEVLRITPGGRVERLWSFTQETVYSLLWQSNRLWIGTGLDGGLYSYRQGELMLEKDLDETQIVALLAGAQGPVVATTNGAVLYRASGTTEPTGTYTSKVLDAEQTARFGTFHWWGEAAGNTLAFSFRCGLSEDPDATWSPWSPPRSGQELSLAELPPGRYLQWRAAFTSQANTSPRLDLAELSYRQENGRPEIRELEVLEPGQVLVPSNFNPANQVYEPAHPNREGIFTTLGDARSDDTRLKPLWKLGYRSLRWKASDPNQDELRYRLEFQRAGDDAWLPMAEDIEDDHLSFDATALPDGIYRFRLQVTDGEANLPSEALTAERISELVVIDHSAPVLAGTKKEGKVLAVTVQDQLNPLREAVFSIDAGPWQPAPSRDGLVDGRKETLLLEAPAGAHLLILRVTDAAYNGTTLDLSGELP